MASSDRSITFAAMRSACAKRYIMSSHTASMLEPQIESWAWLWRRCFQARSMKPFG